VNGHWYVQFFENLFQDFHLAKVKKIAYGCRIADNLFIGYYGLVFLRKEYQLS